MSDTEQQGRGRTGKSPPYVSFRTFQALVQDLHEHGVPSRIDRSVLTRYSGVVGTQLMTALRFFEFIDSSGQPNGEFGDLVKSFGSPTWPSALAVILKRAFSPLFEIDLTTATPSHFSETFRKAFPGSDAVLQKCATFFLYAAREAGVDISERVLKGRKPRPLIRKRATKMGNAKSNGVKNDEENESEGEGEGDADPPHGSGFQRELLAKFPPFDPAWPNELKAEWFKGFEQFMQMAKK